MPENSVAPPFSLDLEPHRRRSRSGRPALAPPERPRRGAAGGGAAGAAGCRRVGRGLVGLLERAAVEPAHHQRRARSRRRSRRTPAIWAWSAPGRPARTLRRASVAKRWPPISSRSWSPISVRSSPTARRIALGEADGVGRRRKLVPVGRSRCFRDGAAESGSGPRYPRGSASFPRARRAAARRPSERPSRPVPRPSASLSAFALGHVPCLKAGAAAVNRRLTDDDTDAAAPSRSSALRMSLGGLASSWSMPAADRRRIERADHRLDRADRRPE